jgi:hypothetical protein
MSDSKPDPKEGGSGFFRKVVKFVANPATNWSDLDGRRDVPPAEPAQGGYAKNELKEMIERKQRNDFVRKRELDMLRKIRREGLVGGDLATLQGAADVQDSMPPPEYGRPDDAAMVTKIDEIEQAMAGEAAVPSGSPRLPPHPTGFYNATTAPALLEGLGASHGLHFAETSPDLPDLAEPHEPPGKVAREYAATLPGPLWGSPQLGTSAPGGRPPDRAATPSTPSGIERPSAVEVTELANDPLLDEAVIAFANAEFEHCESALSALISDRGERARDAPTWLTLFDLYRATGLQHPFESLALDYGLRFGWSPPQWFSIPQRVADASAYKADSQGVAPTPASRGASAGWVAPALIDLASVIDLRARTLQMPMPWVLEWSPVQAVDPEACHELSLLMRHWSTQKIAMRWVGIDRLMSVLTEVAPIGLRDADPVYWLLRLEALRLADRADAFDAAAMDYCMTYEVSPPSWERSQCAIRVADTAGMTVAAALSVTDAPTGFADSRLSENPGGASVAAVELSGQLVGDIDRVLAPLEQSLGSADTVNIHCGRLIRMDFVAAGDLLNWVLRRRAEGRSVRFEDAHRLVGLFFNAMGISEHAEVKVRNV